MQRATKSWNYLFISFILFILAFLNSAYADLSSPVGVWRTIDDKTHQPAGVMQIWEDHGKLYGRVIDIFPQNGNKPTDLCKKCVGKLHNKPILGMTVMWGLIKQDNAWGNGEIMDPKNGKIYRCKLQLSDDGMKLSVRGYIGFSLLGRTQVWERLTNYKIS